MSRCFPFPPPGYEKKGRPDDVELLKQEKLKEKKHKKDKKDKEKREGKEKKEKDRSEGKHKEKKDKKDKHKDKKEKHRDKDKKKEKDKDRDKKKDKSSISQSKKVSGQVESSNGEKLHQKEVENKDKSSRSEEKRPDALQFQGHNGEKPLQSSQPDEAEASKFVHALGRRIRDEEMGAGIQSVERFAGTNHQKDETRKFTVRDTGMPGEGMEKIKDSTVHTSKFDGQGIKTEARFCGNAMVQSLAGVQHKGEGMPKPIETAERMVDGKEQSKDCGGDKHKDKDGEKKSHGKDKDREKEKKKEEKVREKSEHKKAEQDKFKDINKNNHIGVHSNKPSLFPGVSDKDAAAEVNLKKRKDAETNGFLLDSESRPNKIPRLGSHQLAENGRKVDSQTPILHTFDRQGPTNNIKVDKDRRVNGIVGAQPMSAPAAPRPLPVIKHAERIMEAAAKPPHPDSKYLSQLLNLPKMEEWSDFDDQEWLFGSCDRLSKKCEVSPSNVNGEQLVWSEAMHIESSGVCALPYVIPY